MKVLRNLNIYLFLLLFFFNPLPYAEDQVPDVPIPSEISSWMNAERFLNERENDSSAFKPIDIEENEDFAIFDPKNNAKFEIGYIDVPIEETRNIESESLTDLAKNFFYVTKNNKKFLRYFIHPDMLVVKNNGTIKAISKYGEVINGKKSLTFSGYIAAPTSSPRSLVIWHKDDPSTYFGLKVSLSREIGGANRINAEDKLVRASVASQFLDGIPKEVQDAFGVSHYSESLQMPMPGVRFGSILREFGEAFKDGSDQLPGFSLTAKPEDGGLPFLAVQLNKLPQANRYDYVIEKILRPLISMYAYQVWVEGMLGEQHQQNVTLGIKNGDLDGTMRFKDMDAYRIDPETRILQGRSMEAATEVPFKPSDFLKYTKAMRPDSDGFMFIQNSYNNFIRNNWSFLLDKFFERYGSSVGVNWQEDLDGGKKIWRDVDKLFLEESLNYMEPETLLGVAQLNFIENNLNELKRLLPERNWEDDLSAAKNGERVLKYSKEEAKIIIANFEIYKIMNYVDEGNYKFPIFNPGDIYNRFKDEKRAQVLAKEVDPSEQKFLKKQYYRLIDNYRATKKKASAQVKIEKHFRFVLGDGAILVYDMRSGNLHDVATLEPRYVTEDFYAESIAKGHPRVLPSDEDLRRLNMMITGLDQNASCMGMVTNIVRE